MRRRDAPKFTTVKTHGGLFPAEFLERIANEDPTIPGQKSDDYGLLQHERIADGAQRAWGYLAGAWTSFKDGLLKLPQDDHAVRLTRERWLLVLFRELGYGVLQPARSLAIEGKSYALSHVWSESVPIHLMGYRVTLDNRTKGLAGAAKSSPHGLVQEFLNRSDDHLWGFVSNGRFLRVLRDHHSLTRQAYVEFDLETMFDGELTADFLLLWRLVHASRTKGEKPSECWLEKWFTQARDEGVRALDKLRGGVEEAIRALGSGFLKRHESQRLQAGLESGDLDRQDYYRELLRLVYRLIFLFVAEDRDLLLDPEADDDAKKRYRDFYSTARLRRLAERRRSSPYTDLWQALRLVMQKLDEGCPEIALPALDSFLWRDEAVSWVLDAEIGNEDLLDAIDAMSHITDKGIRLPVSWQSIGSEELGSIYEALLELHPDIHRETGTFTLGSAAGHERKTTGSYYTPASLVDCLLDSALDPVVDEAAKKDDPERAILDLKVCDPACGSGHFLVAAARRMARRLANVRSGDEEPSPIDLQHALRDVVGRCIYGVDINPMAVELCKVSLWMEALEPGKPLSFLDHHIQCGNSLLGATPALLRKGIPDEAFTPIEGDDKATVRELKRVNKAERESRQIPLNLKEEEPALRRQGDLAVVMRQLDIIPDDTVQGIHEKEKGFNEYLDSSSYRYSRLWADAWCSAFVWEKVESTDTPYPMTEGLFRKIEANPRDVSRYHEGMVRGLARQYGLFHWHLAYPDVFCVPADPEVAENQASGWSGGFDIVLGNPPWERVKLQEKEWFSTRDAKIAKASNAAARRRRIADLAEKNSELLSAWLAAKRTTEGTSSLIRNAERFPLCGRGDVNTYSVFAELNRSLITSRGRVGCIVPTGIATDDTTKMFFQDLGNNGALHSLFDFQSGPGLWSEIGHARFKFCLLTMLGLGLRAASTEFAFFLRHVDHMAEEGRMFSLSASDINLINPNTRTCPIFLTSRDANITKAIYRRIPVLINEGQGENPWGVTFKRAFDMANDSGLFTTYDELASQGGSLVGNVSTKGQHRYLPLYEAKMVHHFNHRFGDYRDRPPGSESTALPAVPAEKLDNPLYSPQSRYWVPAQQVGDRMMGRWARGWLLGWRDICRSTDERTVIAGIVPTYGVGDKFLLMLPDRHPTLIGAFFANLVSFAFDYVARQKLGGTSLKYFTMKQLPPLPPTAYSAKTPWATNSCGDWLLPRVLELTYTAWDLQPFAQDVGYDDPPFKWDEERRRMLRAELDAAFFHLYEIERDDVDYIMETFPIVKRKDIKKHGDYRTKLMILHVYDAMQTAMDTGEPYQTMLDPPPADPRVAHPPRDEMAPVVPFPVPSREEVYETEPQELLEVAEEEVSYAGPGEVDASEVVASWLADNPGWHARAEILDATTLGTAEWNRAIGALVSSGEVERTGVKRGTRYRLADADVPDAPPPADATDETAASDEEIEHYTAILDWLTDHPGWHARAEVLADVELTEAEWNQVVGDLVETGEVDKKGEKRGTRYRLRGDVGQMVIDWMSHNPGWHGRAEILDAVEIDVADWNRAIVGLVESGEVEKAGEKRGTRYRYRGDDRHLVATWFEDNAGWHARADILDDLELDVADWNRVIGDLVSSGEVVSKGEKRGTRYRWWEHEEQLLF